MVANKQQIEACKGKVTSFSIEQTCKSSSLMQNLRNVIESHPNESAKNLGMSIFYLINGEHRKMLECLEFLVEKHPEIAEIQRRVGEGYINKNDYQTAIPHLKNAIKLNEEDLTAKIWLSFSYFAIGDEKKAKICLDLIKPDVFLLHAENSKWFEPENT